MKNTKIQLGKEYQFAGYNWTACELINNGKTLVIQSHGVTHGAWPGLVMSQFGNGNYYSKSIDGEDISAYDDKMRSLYDAIKDVEDKSASYGKGLFLISKEKADYVEFERTGSGNYWKVLQGVSMNYSQFGATCFSTWLGTVADANSGTALSMDIGGCIGYSIYNQPNEYAIAPAFNLDLSKVEIVGDDIIKKSKFDFASMVVTEQFDSSKELTDSSQYRSIWEYGMNLTKDDETLHLDPEMINQIFEAIKEDNGRNYVATYTSRKFDREQYIAICDEVENLLANDSKDVKYCACEHVLGVGFDNYAGQPAPDNVPKKLDF